MRNNELKIGKHYRCEYRLTGIDCKILNWTAGATGVFNVSGGNRLAFSAVDGRTLTVSQAKWGQLAAGMEIFIHTTAADPDGPRIAKIAELDPDAGTITLVEDLGVPAEALANVGKWIGATPELTRPESAFAAGAYVFATGKHAVAVGRNVATAADESFLIGADGELPGTPEYEGAVAVAHGGELVLLVKHYKMAENAETGEPERVPSPSLTFSGVVIADEFRKADGTPIGGGTNGGPVVIGGATLRWNADIGALELSNDGETFHPVTTQSSVTVETSYDNPGGMGDRRGMISVSETGNWRRTEDPGSLIDGTNTHIGLNGVSATDCTIEFDFLFPRVIQEVKFYAYTASFQYGSWVWQGRNSTDGAWSGNLCNPTLLQDDADGCIFNLSTNNTAYRYYRMAGVLGNVNRDGYFHEVNFKIDSGE